MSTVAISTPDTSRNMSTTSSRSSSASMSPTALTSVVSTPRVGTEFKDRIFVGGFPPTTTDYELRNFFTKYGTVKEAKIIRDHAGASKGYGFITFETEDQAKKVRESCGGFLNEDNSDVLLDFKGRKLNIGPAIRKASNNSRNQNLEVIPQGAVMVAANGTPYLIQNGLAYCAAPDAYAITHPNVNIGGGYHPLIMPQQYVVGQPHFLFPQNMAPSAMAPIQQQVQPQHVILSPINQSQQSIVSQQHLVPPTMKTLDSPSKMTLHMQPQIQNVNNVADNSHNDSMGQLPNIANLSLNGFNIPPPNSQYQWTSSTMSGPLTQYVYPPCCQQVPYSHEIHPHYQQHAHLGANDAQNPTGVVTPPPTPIMNASKRRRNGGSNSNYT